MSVAVGRSRKDVPLGIAFLRRVLPAPGCCSRNTAYKGLTLFLTFFCYMTYHMSRKAISVVKSTWYPGRNETAGCESHPLNSSLCEAWMPFDSETKLGDLDFVFLLGYAFAMFVSGQIGDRVNLRYFLCCGMLLSGLFTGLLGFAYFFKIHSFAFFIIIQLLGGIVQSTGWPSVVAVMANWFGVGNRGFILGLWNSHTSFGNIFGAIIPGIWVHRNWAWSFIVPGIIIATMGIIILLFLVVDPTDVDLPSPEYHVAPTSAGVRDINYTERDSLLPVPATLSGEADVAPKGGDNSGGGAVGFFTALRIPGVLEYSLCLFFSKFMNYIFLYWLPKYVSDVHIHDDPLSKTQSAYYSSLFDVGGIFGGVILGFVSDRTGANAVPSVVMLLLGIPSLYAFNAYGKDSLGALLGLMAVTGMLLNGPYSLITTAVAADLGTHEVLRDSQKAKATVAAIIDGTGSIGAAIGPYIVGIALQDAADSTESWRIVVNICMGASLLSALFLVRICLKELRRLPCCQRGARPR